MSDIEPKSLATEAVLEWMFLELIKRSANPKQTLAEFNVHMNQKMTELEAFGFQMVRENKQGAFTNAIDAKTAIEEIRKTLTESVTIS